MIDDYTLKARVYPVILTVIPIFIVGIAISYNYNDISRSFGSMGIIACLTFLMAQLGRHQGKKKEKFLWQKWGGSPSTLLLRYSTPDINTSTKEIYHRRLKELFPIAKLSPLQLNTFCELDEDVYITWTKCLIAKTRDKKKYNLLFKENINYGFRRNLWGLKPFAITLICILMCAWYALFSYQYNSYNPTSFPISWLYGNMSLILILLFWTIIVTTNWIKLVAFAYAERLLEATLSL